MIRYHGGPITPTSIADAVWSKRHAFISFERPEQIGLAAEICQSFALDNGAFSVWRRGAVPDWNAYAEWVREFGRHPGCDFAVIPDVIDGSEAENDDLIAWWDAQRLPCVGVPVWHLHESFDRLIGLVAEWPRVALGSSGAFADINTMAWKERMGEAMSVVCDADGYPSCKLHGLRMLSPTVISHYPLASADSTNMARNHNRLELTAGQDVYLMAKRVEEHAAARRWSGTYGTQFNMDLVG